MILNSFNRIVSSKSTCCETALKWMAQNLTDEVNIDSGNGVVSLGNNPLPEPMLTQTYVTIKHH